MIALGERGQGGPGSLAVVLRASGCVTTVALRGALDEAADFADLAGRLTGHVVIDLAQVDRVTAAGVRTWLHFIRDLPRVTDLTLVRCSPAFVMRLNSVYGMQGRARVASFLAPYVCRGCGREDERLLVVAALPWRAGAPLPPLLRCGACGDDLELDEIAARYCAFLEAPRASSSPWR